MKKLALFALLTFFGFQLGIAQKTGFSSGKPKSQSGKSEVSDSPSYAEPAPRNVTPVKNVQTYSESAPKSYNEPAPRSYSAPVQQYGDSPNNTTESYSAPVKSESVSAFPQAAPFAESANQPSTYSNYNTENSSGQVSFRPTQAEPYQFETPSVGRKATSENVSNEISTRLLPSLPPTTLPLPPDFDTPVAAHGLGYLEQEPAEIPTVRPSLEVTGIILLAPPRPRFDTVRIPPRPSGGGIPNSNLLDASEEASFDEEDPYFPTVTNFDDNAVVQFDQMPPAFDCVYNAAEALEMAYLNPDWCNAEFRTQYRWLLQSFHDCYAFLPANYEESWMYSAYLTYADELAFWDVECVIGDEIHGNFRELLSEKAAFVAYLMPAVDAKVRADWQYVDTAFGVPFGGENYFALVEDFEPELLLETMQKWSERMQTVRTWPSYVSLGNLFNGYGKSDLWMLLRQKIQNDLDQAMVVQADSPEKAQNLTENSVWLTLAMLRLEPEAEDLQESKKAAIRQLKGFGYGSEKLMDALKKYP